MDPGDLCIKADADDDPCIRMLSVSVVFPAFVMRND